MTLTEYIKSFRSKPSHDTRPVPAIKCRDGLTMSIQANEYTYCSPRDNDGPWCKFEVGFPSMPIEDLMPYMDGQDSVPTQTVYGYVPETVLMKVIEDHGGSDDL